MFGRVDGVEGEPGGGLAGGGCGAGDGGRCARVTGARNAKASVSSATSFRKQRMGEFMFLNLGEADGCVGV